jgi:hypothetical protein
MLSLAEQFLLLTLLEKKDTICIPSSISLPFALAGATIMDLVLIGKAQLQNGNLILSQNADQVESETMKIAVKRIEKAGKVKKLNHWVYLVGSKGNRLTKAALLSLINQSILVEEKNAYVWASENPEAETPVFNKYQLKRRLRDAVFCQENLDENMLAIFGLLEACELLNHLFTQDEIVAARKKVKSLVKDEGNPSMAELRAQTIAAVRYAVAAAASV